MIIFRVGSTSVSCSRYLDVLQSPDVERLVILSSDNRLTEGIPNALGFAEAERELRDKLEVYSCSYPLLIRVIARVLGHLQRQGLGRVALFESLIDLILRNQSFGVLESVLERFHPDLIWSGSNDYDGSNLITWWIATQDLGIPIVRSYKEHRCRYLIDEENALLKSDALILPSQRNLRAFEKIYSTELEHKTFFADEDWRYSGLIDYVKKQEVENMSILDKEPHIVILSGVVTYGERDVRRGSRYNYLPIIEKLVEHRIHIHLHTKSVIESTQHPVTDPANPYARLDNTSRYFHIESPLDLEKDWSDYLVLKRYDAGLLHNYRENESIARFTRMNVPNRLYEYQLAGVLPVVLKGTLLDVEDIIRDTGFGLIGSSYVEVAEMLLKLIANPHRRPTMADPPSFQDFLSVLLTAYRSVSGLSS